MRLCKISLFLATLAATLTLSAPARADSFTYTYTGGAFTYQESYNEAQIVNTSDHLSITVTLSTELGDNFSGFVAPLSFDSAVVDSQGNVVYALTNSTPGVYSYFYFATANNGQITTWEADASVGNESSASPTSFIDSRLGEDYADFNDENYVYPCFFGACSYSQYSSAYTYATATSNWTIPPPQDLTPAAVTPEPSSLLLAGTGLLGIAFLTRRRLFKPVVFALAAAILPLSARADAVTYTYTGPAFTSADAPYTTQDSITGSFTVAAPLADDMPLTAISPISFSFTDGVTTVNTADFTHGYIEVATNASGQIDEWDIELDTPCIACATTGYSEIDSYYFGGAYGTDSSIYDDNGSTSQASASANGLGQWSATPEPPSLMLLATGLTGCAALVRRGCTTSRPATSRRLTM